MSVIIPQISIIIVNYNTFDEIVKCINSVVLHSSNINYEIIVIDNNSVERDIENLSVLFPNIILILSGENKGFGAGCNIGAKKAKGKYLLFLNPDTIVENDIINELYLFMEKTPNAVALSPNFIYPNGDQGYTFNYFPDIVWEIYELFGRGYGYRIKRFNKMIKTFSIERTPLKVDWNTGACLFVSASKFCDINGFDENYFLYYEDVDLQLRLKEKGGDIYNLPYINVVHSTNASTKKSIDDSVYYYNMGKSKLLYINKHFSFFKRNIFKAIIISGLISRLILINIRRRYAEIKKIKISQYEQLVKLYLKSGRQKTK